MTINYNKSSLVYINMSDIEVAPFLEIFQCVGVSLPIKYLGLPLLEKLRREDLQPLLDNA